jgi:hypothetical protein
MRKLALAIVAVLAAATACSGGGSGGVTAATIDPTQADQLTADATVLQASDLPGTFESRSSSSSSADVDPRPSQEADKCVKAASGASGDALAAQRTAQSKREFQVDTGPNSVTVTGTVSMYRDATGPSTEADPFATAGVGECIRKVFSDEFALFGATSLGLTVVPTNVDGIGDRQLGYVISGPITINGDDIVYAAEIDVVTIGRVSLTVTVDSLQGGADHAYAVAAMTKMANRLPK